MHVIFKYFNVILTYYFVCADVVRAYKALQKERDALQAGLSALSAVRAGVAASSQENVSSSQSQAGQVSDDSTRSNSTLDLLNASNFSKSASSSTIASLASSNQQDELSDLCDPEDDSAQAANNTLESECTSDKVLTKSDSCLKNVDTKRENIVPAKDSEKTSELVAVQELQQRLQTITIAMAGLTTEKETLKKSFMKERKSMAEEKEKVDIIIETFIIYILYSLIYYCI